MIALYVIVRYVIVKPLKHLRDVSEEISKGNTGLRAEINTHDEFEELADAFNRMMRAGRLERGVSPLFRKSVTHLFNVRKSRMERRFRQFRGGPG